MKKTRVLQNLPSGINWRNYKDFLEALFQDINKHMTKLSTFSQGSIKEWEWGKSAASNFYTTLYEDYIISFPGYWGTISFNTLKLYQRVKDYPKIWAAKLAYNYGTDDYAIYDGQSQLSLNQVIASGDYQEMVTYCVRHKGVGDSAITWCDLREVPDNRVDFMMWDFIESQHDNYLNFRDAMIESVEEQYGFLAGLEGYFAPAVDNYRLGRISNLKDVLGWQYKTKQFIGVPTLDISEAKLNIRSLFLCVFDLDEDVQITAAKIVHATRRYNVIVPVPSTDNESFKQLVSIGASLECLVNAAVAEGIEFLWDSKIVNQDEAEATPRLVEEDKTVVTTSGKKEIVLDEDEPKNREYTYSTYAQNFGIPALVATIVDTCKLLPSDDKDSWDASFCAAWKQYVEN